MQDFLNELSNMSGTVICYNLDILVDFVKKVESDFSGINNFKLLFAVKANNDIRVLETLVKQGIGMDCASKEEIDLAIKVGSSYISATGPGFDLNDISYYYTNKSYRLNFDIDNFSQLKATAVSISAGIRIKLNESTSRFGLKVSNKLIEYILSHNITIKRIHFHQENRNLESLQNTYSKLIRLICENSIFENLEEINLGGGFESFYVRRQEHELVRIIKNLKEKLEEHLQHTITVIIEPGSLLALPIGYLKTDVKYVEDSSNYAILNVSAFNLTSWSHVHPIMHNHCYIKKVSDGQYRYSLAGNTCYEDDKFGSFAFYQKLKPKDTLVLFPVGAYNFSLIRNLHNAPPPKLIYYKNGKFIL